MRGGYEKEEKDSTTDMNARNAARHDADKAAWGLRVGMERMGLRNKPGRKPQWKHTEATGAYVRKHMGSIDWYRYQKVVLKPLRLPFAQECKVSRPNTPVMEDNAPVHASHYQFEVYELFEILKLPWTGNSPDLNAIEPTWWWMKRETSKKGRVGGTKELKGG